MCKSILFLLSGILAAITVVAQDTFTLKKNQTQTYSVSNSSNNFTWNVYDNINPFTLTNSTKYVITGSTTTNEVTVTWKQTGEYFIVVKEDNGGCSTILASKVIVSEPDYKFFITDTSSSQCYLSSLSDVTVSLSFLDGDNNPLLKSDFPITVNYTLNGVAQTAQSVLYSAQYLTISGSDLTSDPSSDTPNTIVITGATDANSLTITPVTGQDTHIHTVNALPTASYTLSASPATICNGSSTTLSLSGSQTGVNYYLRTGTDNISMVAGTGSSISFAAVSPTTTTTYNVLATNTNCSAQVTDTKEVTVLPLPAIALDTKTSPTTCSGTDGSIQLTGLSASTTYTVNYTDGSGAQSASLITDGSGNLLIGSLGAGSYSNISVTSAAGCTSNIISGPVVLSAPGTATIAFVSSTGPTTCSGSDGSIVISGLDNNTSYTVDYKKDGTDVSASITSDGTGKLTISGLTAGSYSDITVTRSGCTSNALAGPFALSDPDAPVAPSNAVDQSVCLGSTTPALSVSVGSGETADWYDVASGGTPLVSGATSYTPVQSAAGTYTYYAETRNTTTGCTSSTRTQVTLTINALPTIAVSTPAACAANLLTYSLGVTVSAGNVTATAGTVTNTSGNTWTVSDITSGTNITITVTDGNGCSNTLNVTAPVCSCPVVAAPSNAVDQSVCLGSTTPALSVTVGTGETADWYDAASGGTPLVSGTTSYTPVAATAGTYTFYAETRNTTTGCTSSTRTPVTLTINALPTITVSTPAACAANLLTYSLGVTVSAGNVTATAGTVAISSGNIWTVSAVPAGTNITITVTDANGCSNSLDVTAPVCSCPVVTAPVNVGDQSVCMGSTTPALSVTVGTGETADWYDAASGGTPLVSGSTSYTPVAATAGTYTFYAETRNTTTGCTSSTRTPVTLTINALPTIAVSTPAACAANLLTYSVGVTVSAGNVTATAGTVTNTSGNIWTVSDITSGTNITITVTDGNGCSNTLNVTAPVCSTENRAPAAMDDTYTTEYETPVSGDLSSNDSDPDNDILTYNTTPVTNCSNGTVVINSDGTFTYTPNSGFSGSDTFEYRVCDDGSPSKCSEAWVSVNVAEQGNRAPVAVNDINNTVVNTAVSGNVLTNDYDPDGNSLAVISNLYASPSNGTVKMNNDGTYTYTPNSGFEGEDFFMYVVCDVGTSPVLCDTATVTIEVRSDTQGNRAPVANEDEVHTSVNTAVSGNVLLNDYDPDLDNFSVSSIISNVKNGTLTFNKNDGTFTYTPNTGFEGTDEFVYEICDDATPSLCSQATVTISVEQPEEGNNAPFAADDAIYTTGDAVSVDVSKNDSDPDGDKLTYTVYSDPSKGTVTMNGDGTCVYTPNTDAKDGTDQFVYQVCDNGTPSLCSKATVYVTVMINHTPVAVDDELVCMTNETATDNVLTNDSDPDKDALTVNTTPVSGPSNGTIALAADGSYTYTPNKGFAGNDSITYEVCDDGTPKKCAQAKLYITVQNSANADRLATNDINSTIENQPVSGNVLTNDNDYADANSTVSLYTPPANGTVTIETNGDYTYTPAKDYTGTDNFYYIVCTNDPPADCDTVNVSITVIPAEVKNGPVANDDETETTVGKAVTSNLLANDYSPSGEDMELNLQPVSGPSNGSVVLSSDGQYTYTPDAGFTGTDQFIYEVCGSVTDICATATVTITVEDTDENQVFAADDALFTYGTPVSGNVLANDIYPDSSTLKVTQSASPSNGSVTFNPDGTFTYTPNTGFEGVDHFTYEICDVSLNICDDATVTIVVLPEPQKYADLSVTKTSTPELRENDEITFVVTVSNLGNSTAENVKVNDILAACIQNAKYAVGSSTTNSTWSGTLKIGDLTENQSVEIYIKGTVGKNAPDTIVNYASVASDTWDPDYDNNISVAKTTVNKTPEIIIAGGTTLTIGCCNTEGITIDASQTTGETALHFSWSPSTYLDDPTSSTPHFTPGEDTQYTLTVTDENGLSSKETVTVQIADCPDAVTDGYIFVETAGSTIIADGSESTGRGISYRWWTNDGIILSGETNSTAQISGLGKYYLEVTDLYGCSNVDSLIVGLYIQAINDTVETNLNTSVDINVISNDIPQGAIDPSTLTIVDQPSHGTAMVVADSLITYTPNQYYAGNDEFVYKICDYFMNCDEATVLVIINDQPLFIPEAFSPNNDGVNDYFEIQGISKYKRVQIEIFNRWGNRVYSSSNYGLGEGRDGYWDGVANSGVRLGGGPVPSGTYFYVIRFDNGEKISGSVYIDR